MIVSFFNKDFKGLQNNASLVVDNASYSLIRRGVDLDTLTCKCEAFTENIQPTFLVVKNDRGNYIYGCLAGIPQLNSSNQTEITGSDLKTMLKSDVVLNGANAFYTVNAYLRFVFNAWNIQVNQDSFNCELVFNDNVGDIEFENLKPSSDGYVVVNAWENVFSPYLKYYDLYMTGEIDLVERKVIFQIGKSRRRNLNVKLWEHGIYNYGKWLADVNETQGYVVNKTTGKLIEGFKWILTSQNAITTIPENRDIYPVKRKVVIKETEDETKEVSLLNQANQESLEMLTNSMFNENIEIAGIEANFETRFNIYVNKGEGLYKSLPCGELHYDAVGLKKIQIGYRFTGIQFLF